MTPPWVPLALPECPWSLLELRFSVWWSPWSSVGLVWNRLFDLGMFWNVEFKPLALSAFGSPFWPRPLDVPMRCELTSLPLTGVMMLPWGITIAYRAIELVLLVVDRACMIFCRWGGKSTSGPLAASSALFVLISS